MVTSGLVGEDTSYLESPPQESLQKRRKEAPAPLHLDVSLINRDTINGLNASRLSTGSEDCKTNLSRTSSPSLGSSATLVRSVRHVGPLGADILSDGDPAIAYMRLQNFARRRKSLLNRGSGNSGGDENPIEPITPFQIHGSADYEFNGSRPGSKQCSPKNKFRLGWSFDAEECSEPPRSARSELRYRVGSGLYNGSSKASSKVHSTTGTPIGSPEPDLAVALNMAPTIISWPVDQPEASITFAITLEKSSCHDKLGLDVDTANGKAFTVDSIGEGIVSIYNKEADYEKRIRPGDRIIAINDAREDAQAMHSIASQCMQLTLVIERPSSQAAVTGTPPCSHLDPLPELDLGAAAPRPRRCERSSTTGLDIDISPTPDEEAREAERVMSIMRHLEEMNSAAADLNAVQEGRSTCLHERQMLVQMWAVGSARLARAIGAKQLAKARPFFQRVRDCKALRKKVEVASRAFLRAQQATAPDHELEILAEKHAAALREFLALKAEVDKMKSHKIKASTYEAVKPYFDAEDTNSAQLEEADATVAYLDRKVRVAKLRYRRALRNLEELSNEAHLERGTLASTEAPKPQTPVLDTAQEPPNEDFLSRRGSIGSTYGYYSYGSTSVVAVAEICEGEFSKTQSQDLDSQEEGDHLGEHSELPLKSADLQLEAEHVAEELGSEKEQLVLDEAHITTEAVDAAEQRFEDVHSKEDSKVAEAVAVENQRLEQEQLKTQEVEAMAEDMQALEQPFPSEAAPFEDQRFKEKQLTAHGASLGKANRAEERSEEAALEAKHELHVSEATANEKRNLEEDQLDDGEQHAVTATEVFLNVEMESPLVEEVVAEELRLEGQATHVGSLGHESNESQMQVEEERLDEEAAIGKQALDEGGSGPEEQRLVLQDSAVERMISVEEQRLEQENAEVGEEHVRGEVHVVETQRLQQQAKEGEDVNSAERIEADELRLKEEECTVAKADRAEEERSEVAALEAKRELHVSEAIANEKRNLEEDQLDDGEQEVFLNVEMERSLVEEVVAEKLRFEGQATHVGSLGHESNESQMQVEEERLDAEAAIGKQALGEGESGSEEQRLVLQDSAVERMISVEEQRLEQENAEVGEEHVRGEVHVVETQRLQQQAKEGEDVNSAERIEADELRLKEEECTVAKADRAEEERSEVAALEAKRELHVSEAIANEKRNLEEDQLDDGEQEVFLNVEMERSLVEEVVAEKLRFEGQATHVGSLGHESNESQMQVEEERLDAEAAIGKQALGEGESGSEEQRLVLQDSAVERMISVEEQRLEQENAEVGEKHFRAGVHVVEAQRLQQQEKEGEDVSSAERIEVDEQTLEEVHANVAEERLLLITEEQS